jgi:hypothetical protein
MNRRSAWHRLGAAGSILLWLAASAAADARIGRAARQAPLLAVGWGGCGFRPALAAVVERVHAKVPDAEPYKAWEAVRFLFGPLHGIGVIAEANADFSGETLYFREDRAALRRVLAGIGLHLDRDGNVVEAEKFTDGGHGMVSVSIHAVDAAHHEPHFPAARSYLSCGSL